MSNELSKSVKKKMMLGALEKSLGIVTTACERTGVGRKTHYRWLKEDSAYREACEDIANIELDFVESKLHQAIKDLIPACIIFYLKCKGRKRGYIEKHDLVLDSSSFRMRDLTDEQLCELASREIE